jgi:lipopolysaccharide transport system ATP-binding protein
MLGMRWRDITRKFDSIVAFAEADKWVDTPVRTYSSGMLMRLGFSVAAHMDPDVLIVDEILATGDESFRARVRRRLREEASAGRAVLFVSHYVEEVQLLCDRVVWMEAGEIVHEGPTQAITQRYLVESREGAGED